MWPSRRSFSSVSSGFLGKLLREPRLLVSNKNVTDSRVVSVAGDAPAV